MAEPQPAPVSQAADGAALAVVAFAVAVAAAVGVITVQQANYALPREHVDLAIPLALHGMALSGAGVVALGLALVNGSLLVTGRDSKWPAPELVGGIASVAAIFGLLPGFQAAIQLWGAMPWTDPLILGTFVFAGGCAFSAVAGAAMRLLAPRRLRLVVELVCWTCCAVGFAVLAFLGPTQHTPFLG